MSAAVLYGCGQSQYRRTAGAVWGTTYHITYKSDRNLDDSVVAEMRRVELSLSAFDATSTVSRINRGETDSVDRMFAEVFELSQRVNRLSGGAFDPTVAPLVNLWGFGYRDNGGLLPSSEAMSEALRAVGIARCSIDGMRVVRADSATEFDFSAVAKGYGVDRVADVLRRNGCTDYMIEIGGEVATTGVNPRGEVWRIAIDAPLSGNPGDSTIQVIELDNAAVATSGNYRNYINISADSVIGHTIDPRTGYPAARSTLSATVIAPTCALADALATACMVADRETAIAMADSMADVRIILVSRDSQGEWVVSDSSH
ncbi:MAG: FAD:protein FMN transferase [Bacteroidales bacterium]|nr:FAD:protein FMN transferase [Bacteroidales bacterium]